MLLCKISVSLPDLSPALTSNAWWVLKNALRRAAAFAACVKLPHLALCTLEVILMEKLPEKMVMFSQRQWQSCLYWLDSAVQRTKAMVPGWCPFVKSSCADCVTCRSDLPLKWKPLSRWVRAKLVMSLADYLSVLPVHLYAAFAVSYTQGYSSSACVSVRHLVPLMWNKFSFLSLASY